MIFAELLVYHSVNGPILEHIELSKEVLYHFDLRPFAYFTGHSVDHFLSYSVLQLSSSIYIWESKLTPSLSFMSYKEVSNQGVFDEAPPLFLMLFAFPNKTSSSQAWGKGRI